ncbi:hypothetical protein [Tardiphaga sp.]|uniref:hypothetical protein n=1 Tax=Tardiphaga sp. TaxID=1926292 RepID=UPI003529FC66
MDLLVLALFVATMFVVGHLAHARGFNRKHWLWIAAAIGPVAIPAIYLADAITYLRKTIAGLKA